MTIIPRWEWRVFGERFGSAEDRLGSLPRERVDESDETYLVSRHSDASVKVRGGQMDVKQLEQVNDDGLEQWRPILKASFPLGAADVAFVFDTLHVSVPELARESYALQELLDEVIAGVPDLLPVRIHKHREHVTLGGCMAEHTTMRTDQGAVRTIAIESEEPERVTAAVRELGLESQRVVNVASGIKTLVGFGVKRYAVIDVGTNSVKFHVGDRSPDGTWRTVVDRAEVTRLGEGLADSGRLGEAAMERTAAAIASMADEARGVEAIAAVGTAWIRIASNTAEFVALVRERCGVEIEAVSGEEEARLAYVATFSGLSFVPASLVVFDTGGGSSQFTFGVGDRVDERFSVNVGAVRLTERFGLDGIVSEAVLADALAAIAGDLSRVAGTPDAIVGMGGAVTNLAAVKHELAAYDPDVIQGTVLDLGEIDRQIELYRGLGAEDRRAIVGLQPARAEVILAGACVVRTVLTLLGRDSLTVSDRGLRHGLLVERFADR